MVTMLEYEVLPTINEGLGQIDGNSFVNDCQQIGVEQKVGEIQDIHSENKVLIDFE